jgi:hypothetical protein
MRPGRGVLYQWIRVTSIDNRRDAAWLPDEVHDLLEPTRPNAGAKVTWRIPNRVASGSGFMAAAHFRAIKDGAFDPKRTTGDSHVSSISLSPLTARWCSLQV